MIGRGREREGRGEWRKRTSLKQENTIRNFSEEDDDEEKTIKREKKENMTSANWDTWTNRHSYCYLLLRGGSCVYV